MISGIATYQPLPVDNRATGMGHAAPGGGPHGAAHGSRAVTDKVSLSGKTKDLQSREQQPFAPGEKKLTEEQKREVDKLKKRDQEVKAHEQAHMAAGGGLVQGGASFTFQRGPDGKTYAVGGEVKIDTSAERDPDQTIRKMQQVKRAALAPAQPSGTDRSVAARAAQVEAKARVEKAKAENEEMTKNTGPVENPTQSYSPFDPPPYQNSSRGQTIDIAV